MGELNKYQIEKRTNRAITVESGSGPGRWVESESQEALARLDARLNPDHGAAGPGIYVGTDDAAEHLAQVNAFFEGADSAVGPDAAATQLAAANAFFEGGDSAVADLGGDVSQATWDEIRPTPF